MDRYRFAVRADVLAGVDGGGAARTLAEAWIDGKGRIRMLRVDSDALAHGDSGLRWTTRVTLRLPSFDAGLAPLTLPDPAASVSPPDARSRFVYPFGPAVRAAVPTSVAGP